MTAVSDETGRDFPFADKETLARWLSEHFYVAEGEPENWDDLPEWHRARFRNYAQLLWHVIAALSTSPVAQEPVAWQWRYKGPSLAVDDDGWSVWLPIEYSIESFRETFADKIERGTVEYRPLYAGTPPATPAGVGADEIAQIIATKCFDPRVIDSSGKPFWKKSQWREAQQAANAILLLLSGGRSEQERSQMEGSL